VSLYCKQRIKNMSNITSNDKNCLEHALKYLDFGFSVIPVGNDKKPLIRWEKYQKEKATEEEVEKWFSDSDNYNIGIITGEISGIVVVDVEAGGKTENLPPTVISKTGGGGWHFFYKHPSKPIKNSVRIREKTDIRGDGGYVVAPPSRHKSGNKYEWLVSPEEANFAELPQWVLEGTISNEKQKTDWQAVTQGVREGQRNETATSFIGKLLHDLSPELWETAGWDSVVVWNKKNSPPLSEKELRDAWESIRKRELLNQQGRQAGGSQANQLLKIIERDKDIILFHDELREPYVNLLINGHKEIWRCRSKQFKRWASRSFWESQKKAINSDALNTALTVLEGKACFDGDQYELHNRVAWLDNALYYDLSDKKWSAVKITPEGWEIVKPLILFRRYGHQKGQVEPRPGGDIKEILKFVNLSSSEHKLLLLVYTVACFISGFPHPIPVIYGDQGSAKSTISKLLRKLIDPSLIEVSEFPKTNNEFIQKLSHNWFIFFDNVSYIPEWTSDLLCKASTGAGFSKRELYSDDDDVIYSFKRCVGINGINLVAVKPDLLDRTILFDLGEKIPKDKRIPEGKLWKEFEHKLPEILGSIFDVISKAMKIRKSIKLDSLPRMADFALWGSAIAEALGYTKEEFLQAYYNNIERQNKEVLFESLVASAIISLTEESSFWEGSPSELLEKLKEIANKQGMNTEKEKAFPKASNALTRRLNELKSNLAEAGIKIERNDSGKHRQIIIQKVLKNTVSIVEPSQANANKETPGTVPKDDIDDTTSNIVSENPLFSKGKDDKDDKDGIF